MIGALAVALALVVGTFVIGPALRGGSASTAATASAVAATSVSPTASTSTPATTTVATPGVTPAQQAGEWPTALEPPGVSNPAPSPQFPQSLPGYRLSTTWTVSVQAIVGSTTPVPGPGGAAFPTISAGCSTQRALLRWTSSAPNALVRATWSGASAGTSAAGWMDVDGCRSPTLTLTGHTNAPGVEGEGLAATDIQVDIQRYTSSASAPSAQCGTNLDAPAVLAAIASQPPEPASGYGWVSTPSGGNYDPCATLSGVIVQPAGGTGGTPVLVLLFHDGQLVGPATSRPKSFTRFETTASSDDTVVLGFRVPGTGTCNACNDSTYSEVQFTWNGSGVTTTGTIPS